MSCNRPDCPNQTYLPKSKHRETPWCAQTNSSIHSHRRSGNGTWSSLAATLPDRCSSITHPAEHSCIQAGAHEQVAWCPWLGADLAGRGLSVRTADEEGYHKADCQEGTGARQRAEGGTDAFTKQVPRVSPC